MIRQLALEHWPSMRTPGTASPDQPSAFVKPEGLAGLQIVLGRPASARTQGPACVPQGLQYQTNRLHVCHKAREAPKPYQEALPVPENRAQLAQQREAACFRFIHQHLRMAWVARSCMQAWQGCSTVKDRCVWLAGWLAHV